ncbi:hypothetical protein L3X38_032495 [Prunus dulcis]|uniref:Uncharacterized protein n=1 Tax=Prunus dulcis TaxID=3755 RepID=A0AAD4YWN9_PRUDU|nr:hypothetical protein L3X38_032495 [Prunus dulcis]
MFHRLQDFWEVLEFRATKQIIRHHNSRQSRIDTNRTEEKRLNKDYTCYDLSIDVFDGLHHEVLGLCLCIDGPGIPAIKKYFECSDRGRQTMEFGFPPSVKLVRIA